MILPVTIGGSITDGTNHPHGSSGRTPCSMVRHQSLKPIPTFCRAVWILSVIQHCNGARTVATRSTGDPWPKPVSPLCKVVWHSDAMYHLKAIVRRDCTRVLAIACRLIIRAEHCDRRNYFSLYYIKSYLESYWSPTKLILIV